MKDTFDPFSDTVQPTVQSLLILKVRKYFIIIIILMIALAVRLWGIEFGLPYRYHIDEPPQIVNALRAANGDIYINYPPLSPNFHQISLALIFCIYYFFLHSIQVVSDPAHFASLYQENPSNFYLLSRGFTVVNSLVSISLLYLLVRRVYNHRVALIATIFISFNLLDVREAHFAKLYHLINIFILLCIFFSLIFLEKRIKSYLILAGICAGIAIGMRYSMVPIILAPISSVLLGQNHSLVDSMKTKFIRIIRYFLVIIPSAILGIIIGTPSVLINTGNILSNMSVWVDYVLKNEGFQGFQFTTMTSPQFYFYILELSWGIPIVLLIFVGIMITILHFQKYFIIIYVFPLSYLTIILNAPSSSAVFARYLIPLIPFLSIMAALGIIWLIDKIKHTQLSFRIESGLDKSFPQLQSKNITLHNLVFNILLIGFLIIPIMQIIRLDLLFSREDTRTLAKRWIETHISEQSVIAAQWHSPPLSTIDEPEPRSLRIYDVTKIYPFSSSTKFYSFDYYIQNGYQYLILSNFIYDLKRIDMDENQVRNMFYESLKQKGKLIAEFRPYNIDENVDFFFEQIWGPINDLWILDRPGPIIKIYQLTKTK